jgi:C-terminal processing protease CtpA/Prc
VFTLKSDGSEKEFRNTDIDGFTAPIAVLVNRQTRGCAEAVAAALRAQGRAIVIGNRSAGSAAVHSDILLDEKHVLRVATGKIIFPGALEVFPKGLTPDIEVEISEQTERDFLISKPPKKTLTELFQPAPTRPRVNEAELVRAQRGEATTLMQPAATPSEPPQEIPDTVLQRAVDLLKGLTALSPDAASGN